MIELAAALLVVGIVLRFSVVTVVTLCDLFSSLGEASSPAAAESARERREYGCIGPEAYL